MRDGEYEKQSWASPPCPPEVHVKIILTLTLLSLSLAAAAQSRLMHTTPNATFQQLSEITGTQGGDDFGYSIAVGGNTLVVGAPFASVACENCGAAYVYTAVNGDWANLTLLATLTPPPGHGVGGGFGSPVAVSGNTIAVGGFDGESQEAAAYVYVNPSGNAVLTAELTTSVETADEVEGIGIGSDTIVLGIPEASVGAHGEGAAFVYVEPNTGWANATETAELLSTDLNTFFGHSVAISGRNIVVGAFEAKVGGVEQGAAYLFVEPAAGWNGSWGPTTTFQASNGTKNAAFGTSVAVSGETVAVGAPDEVVGSSDNEGAVYMFTRPSSGWGAGPALLFACATTNEAAPAFVVFESWAPHRLRAGLSSRHIHGHRLCANRSSCPINFAATTVRDISISLRPVVIGGSLCSRGHRIAICCFVSWRGYGGDTTSW